MIINLKNNLNFKMRKPVELDISNIMKEKIDRCWKEFIKDKENYWNGDIFVVTNLDLNESIIEISKTQYSSLVYAKHNKDLILKPLFAGILLKTKDNKYIIIKNNHNNINIIGGMPDASDFLNSNFSPDSCIQREVLEEIGIDINNKSQMLDYHMKYLKIQTNSENYYTIGILYTGILNFTSQEFKKYVNSNNFEGEIKEYYFYSAEECLKLKLTNSDISYLKEFITIENKID